MVDTQDQMVLSDLQKAFDTVDHTILSDKLETMGLGSRWFKSYLKERTQKVKVGDTISGSMPIACGVPQGSILGPLLFLCYLNDMAASTKCKVLLYADDSILLTSDKDPKAITETLSRNLDTCNDWLVDNRLPLHLGKTKAMICATKQKTTPPKKIKQHRELYSQTQSHNNYNYYRSEISGCELGQFTEWGRDFRQYCQEMLR